MNSLEDAFVNIAKEEEKLLERLKEHGVLRQSQIEGTNQITATNQNDNRTLQDRASDTGTVISDVSAGASEVQHDYKQIDPIELQRYYTCVRNPTFVW